MRSALPCALALTTLLAALATGCAADTDGEGDVLASTDDELKAAREVYSCINAAEHFGVGLKVEGTGMELWWLDEAREIGIGKIDPKYKPTNPANAAFVAYKGFPELLDAQEPGSITILLEKPLLRRAPTGTAKFRGVTSQGAFTEYVLNCDRR